MHGELDHAVTQPVERFGNHLQMFRKVGRTGSPQTVDGGGHKSLSVASGMSPDVATSILKCFS